MTAEFTVEPRRRMKCSVCDRLFVVTRSVLPVAEIAGRHDQVVGAVLYEGTHCPGSGAALLPPTDLQPMGDAAGSA